MRGSSSGEGPSLRQATLFQAWGKKSRTQEEEEEEEEEEGAPRANEEEEDLEEDLEDGGGSSAWLFPVAPAPAPAPAPSSAAAPGSSSPVPPPPPLLLLPRGYQARAAGSALAANTLLCLPTGLGKTRVAAAVLFNFARWFPRGKSLFLAPTRPLVAQQRRACGGILPARHTALLLAHGGTQIADRKEIWRTKRVFFLTPQIMVNDLSRGICPAAEVKCLVIDEAHKALGNHAYCQVVKELCKYTKDFRILALTATPGSNTKAVQQVISNLLISHIEVCSEDSPEIQPYSHERQVEKCVIPLGKDLGDIQAAYIQVLEAFAGRLVRLRVLSQREIPSLTKYQIILARDQFRKNPPSHLGGMQPGAIEGDFALCIRLYHGYELLLQMGMRSLYLFLSGIMDGSKGMTRAKNELSRNEDFMKLYSQLENMFSDTAVTSTDGSHPNIGTRNGKPFIYSHPKLKKLEEVVTEHFRSWKERGEPEAPGGRLADTRVMIFSSFRDSVQEIAEMLSRHFPAVKVMTFVGHSSGKSTKGFTQKEQLEVVRRFCEGGYNTLVSTCVGEEGLDIGEVDLIVCFDAQRSPIRLVQRMGRTGRKRQGRVVVLLSEGREERAYDQSQSNSRNLLKALSENKGLHLYQHSPRVIPEGVDPQRHRLMILPEEEEPGGGPSGRERGGHGHRQKGRPYSTSSPGAEPPSLSKSWCLTAEEFGRWDRLYRMKAGDGIRKIAMPPSHFETLEEEEEKQRAPPDPETLELSLTEWTLWQSRPFPTSLVDHSDRCRHFIHVMGMIEQLRQEEGGCSYEQKMKPHFHWEDVDASPPPPPPPPPPPRSNSGPPDAVAPPKPPGPKRPPLVGLASKAPWMSLPTEEELDAESASFLFKATSFKPARRHPPVPSGGGGGATGQADLSPRPECLSASGWPAVEDSGPERWPGENPDHEDNSLGRSPPRGGSASPEQAKPRGFQPVLEESGPRVDPCPSSSAEDAWPLPSPSSPSSSLFYIPPSEADPFRPSGAKVDEDPSWRKHILATTRQLLSQSPPALEEMLLFDGLSENEGQPLGAPGSGVFGVPADEATARGPARPCQGLPEPPGTHSRCSPSGPGEISPTLEASVSQMSDLNWDELFENDDDDGPVGVPGEEGGGGGGGGGVPVANRGLKVDPVGTDDGGRGPGPGERLRRNPSADEKAVPLLESHCFTERSSPSPGRKGGRPAVGPEPCRPADPRTPQAGTAVEDQPSGGLPAACQAVPTSPLTPERDVSLGAAGERSLLPLPGPYDASQELFSVNFDLGFSLQESEEEASEGGSPVGEGRGGRRPALGSSLEWGTRRTPPSSLSRDRLDRATFSTPLPSKSHNGGLSAAGPALPLVSPLTPAGEKRCQTPDSDPSPLAATPAGGRGTMPQGGGSRGGGGGGGGSALSLLPGKRRGSPEGVPLLLSRKASHSIVKALAKAAFENEEDPGPREAGKTGHKDALPGRPARAGSSSESEGEIIFLGKTKRKRNVLTSPRIQSYDLESPVRAIKRKRCLLIASDPSSDESAGFAERPRRAPGDSASGRSKEPREGAKRWKSKESAAAEAAKDFLDGEAEVSAEGAAEVSPDESLASEDELSSSLVQFVNDDTEITQDLNESEMQAVYLKSVRSPALGNQYKMVHKRPSLTTVFSQVPEPEEGYVADSFCVEDDPEEGDPLAGNSGAESEECVDLDLLQEEEEEEESFVDGRKQYNTRHRRKRREGGRGPPGQPGRRPSRLCRLSSSSEEEEGGVSSGGPGGVPPIPDAGRTSARVSPLPALDPSLPQRAACLPPLLELQAGLSEGLDFLPEGKGHGQRERLLRTLQEEPGGAPPPSVAPPGRQPPALCVLADSREVASGPEVISTLKAAHGVKVRVCSLGGCDYVVSPRLAVERTRPAELMNGAQQSRAAQRVQQLKRTFERICIIVEKERPKAGEAWRASHRTQRYDSLLSAFVRAGVRLLFSSGQEETAGLLAELVQVERRKAGAAMAVPTEEAEGPKRDAFQFYLSIPGVSYPLALAFCHRFGSVREMVNSSPGEMAARAQVTLQKAQEVHRYIHYGFEAQMLPGVLT